MEHAATSSADETPIGPPVDGIHEEVGESEMILYLEDADTVVTLNETGSALWTMCDGTRTLAEVVEALAQAYGVERGEIEADVVRLVGELREAGFLPA